MKKSFFSMFLATAMTISLFSVPVSSYTENKDYIIGYEIEINGESVFKINAERVPELPLRLDKPYKFFMKFLFDLSDSVVVYTVGTTTTPMIGGFDYVFINGYAYGIFRTEEVRNYNKGELIGEVLYNSDQRDVRKLKSGTANILPIGTKLYAVPNEKNVILAELDGELIIYDFLYNIRYTNNFERR